MNQDTCPRAAACSLKEEKPQWPYWVNITTGHTCDSITYFVLDLCDPLEALELTPYHTSGFIKSFPVPTAGHCLYFELFSLTCFACHFLAFAMNYHIMDLGQFSELPPYPSSALPQWHCSCLFL